MKAMNMFKKMVCGLMAAVTVVTAVALNVPVAYALGDWEPQPTVKASNVASTGKPVLSWDKAKKGADFYGVYRAIGDGEFKRLTICYGTKLTNTSAVAGATYRYKVTVVKDGHQVVESEPVTRTCDLPRPEMKVSGGNQCPPCIEWTKVPGASGYEVWASHEGGEYKRIYKTKSGTKVVHKSAETNSSYRYKVRAIASKSAANSAFTPSVFVDTTVDTRAPGCPVLTVKNVPKSGKPYLEWNNVPGAVKYEVYRKYAKEGSKFSLLTSTKGTHLTNSSAKAGETYFYMVRAVSADPELSGDSNIVKRTCDLEMPSTIGNFATGEAPRMKWDEVPGAVKYEVWCSVDSDDNYKLLLSTSGTKLTHRSAKPGHIYIYKVRAIAHKSAANSAFTFPVGTRV